jgi:hypothetical protein
MALTPCERSCGFEQNEASFSSNFALHLVERMKFGLCSKRCSFPSFML